MSDVSVRLEDVIEMNRLLKERTLEGLGLIGRIEALREVLEECVDELEGWVEHHYERTKDHGLRRQYDRDMGAVLRARRLLNER